MADNTTSGGGATISVSLSLTSSPSSPRITISVPTSATATQLRDIATSSTKIPPSSLKLIFRGRLIANDDEKAVVAEYKLEDGCVVHCMGKPSSSGDAVSVAAPAAVAAAGPSISLPSTAATTPAAVSSTPSSTSSSLTTALQTLQSQNTPSDYTTAVTTLSKILTNITSHPMEEKYRRMKRSNAAFQKRLGGKPGGDACLTAVGFDLVDDVYVLTPSAAKWEALTGYKAEVERAVGAARGTAGSAGWGGTSAGGVPEVAQTGGGGMGLPPFGGLGSAAAQSLMSNPNALREMLQNPMVQQAMQNDPRMANNPMLRQSIDALTSNPEMINQVSTMMNDPTMRQQMQSMMSNPEAMRRMQQMAQTMGGGGG
eukprot:CAMPEP_0172488534 /NCGR_PEP_ID=MMETSP1066-20121228/18094_1 /TAXON_ID=671091 /ORGANISM="Coscinodiscus wailesii, Strain CCMP2513" /LENGTH=369 /DNA_ID=CAMNT_0013255811 /DNA_START=182 /DNA_END=1288 /DNA_ORIENTATION=+